MKIFNKALMASMFGLFVVLAYSAQGLATSPPPDLTLVQHYHDFGHYQWTYETCQTTPEWSSVPFATEFDYGAVTVPSGYNSIRITVTGVQTFIGDEFALFLLGCTYTGAPSGYCNPGTDFASGYSGFVSQRSTAEYPHYVNPVSYSWCVPANPALAGIPQAYGLWISSTSFEDEFPTEACISNENINVVASASYCTQGLPNGLAPTATPPSGTDSPLNTNIPSNPND